MSADQTIPELISPEQRIASLENALAHERERRELEHDAFVKHKDLLFHHLTILRKKSGRQQEAQRAARQKRQHSCVRLVVIALLSLVLLVVPCTLQKLCIIGPQLAYALQCSLLMVISWCYALIWDRTRK